MPDEGEYQDPLALPYALSIERFCPKMQPLDEDPEVGPSRNTFHLFQIACKNGASYLRAMLSSSTHARLGQLLGRHLWKKAGSFTSRTAGPWLLQSRVRSLMTRALWPILACILLTLARNMELPGGSNLGPPEAKAC